MTTTLDAQGQVDGGVRAKRLTKPQKRMRAAVKYLQDYMRTYSEQYGYMDYTDETFIDDVLYGLGVAIDEEKFRFFKGAQAFKQRLREHLGSNARVQPGRASTADETTGACSASAGTTG